MRRLQPFVWQKLGILHIFYLFMQLFFISFRGARRPLAREPDELYLNDDKTETNFSIDFSAISE